MDEFLKTLDTLKLNTWQRDLIIDLFEKLNGEVVNLKEKEANTICVCKVNE